MIAYLPMTKSTVKGLDTIEHFMEHEYQARISAQISLDPTRLKNPVKHDITGFLVAGGSKRGWTTWFTGVVEPERVEAIAPVVMDLLNVHVSLKHGFMSLGGWTFAFQDFTRDDVIMRYDSQE